MPVFPDATDGSPKFLLVADNENMSSPGSGFAKSSWWMYPMKPIKVGVRSLQSLTLSRYWLEKKYDGHRAILIVERGQKLLWTRQKNRIEIPENLREQLAVMKMEDGTVLDGEIWNPMKRGGWTSDGEEPCCLTFWDCIQSGKENLSKKPIEARRDFLLKILGKGSRDVKAVEQEQATEERVRAVLREAEEFRKQEQSRSGYVHGLVLKAKGSPRRDHATRSTEHPDWMKVVLF